MHPSILITSLLFAQSAGGFLSPSVGYQKYSQNDAFNNDFNSQSGGAGGFRSFSQRVKTDSSLNVQRIGEDGGIDKEKIPEYKMHYFVENEHFGRLIGAFKHGANPNLEYDERDDEGNLLSSGNNMAHLLASKPLESGNNALSVPLIFAAVTEFAVSGGDLKKKNSEGLTPIEKAERSSSGYNKQFAFYMGVLDKNQLQATAEIDDQDDSDAKHTVFNHPTSQLFNLVSQKFNKLSDIGKNRTIELIKAGADVNATRYDADLNFQEKLIIADQDNVSCIEDDGLHNPETDTSYYSKTILQEAKENWGLEKAKRLEQMANMANIGAGVAYQTKAIKDFSEEIESSKGRYSEKDDVANAMDSIKHANMSSLSGWNYAVELFLDEDVPSKKI